MGSSCGACKFLRRKCEDVCVFSPYFSYDQAEVHFAAVHKVFGASNVSKLLSHLAMCQRSAAAITITYEANARLRDPVRGCMSYILALQHQVSMLQDEINSLAAHLGNDYTSEAQRHGPPPTMGDFDRFELCMERDTGGFPTSSGRQAGEQSGIHDPVYKEAMDQLEHCLFSDEPCLWEELSMNALEDDMFWL